MTCEVALHEQTRQPMALGLLVFAIACSPRSGEQAPPEPPSAAPAAPAASTDDNPATAPDSGPAFTVGIVESPPSPRGPTLLTDVRSARHEGFDRVVFEFAGSALPGYHLEFIDKPVRQCGSGDVAPIAGDAWLEVRFEPADAHTPSGAPTIAFREKKLELQVVKELEQICDFEAHVSWVLGMARPNPFRVLTLSAPTRLVVDVKR